MKLTPQTLLAPLHRLVPFALTATLVASPLGTARAAETFEGICDIVVHDAQQDLEDARLAVDLARSDYAAFEEVFKLIDGLWQADAIEELAYLEGRYERDSARLDLERADLVLERQLALVDSYRLACGVGEPSTGDRESLKQVFRRYQLADCDQQAKAVEVATNDLEFSQVMRASVLALRQGQVATRQDVIFAERDVDREEKNLADARARTTSCRARLADRKAVPKPG